MPEPRDGDERLVRYIAGQCTPFEAARMQEWIAADAARWKRYLELERVWRACAGDPARRWNVDTAMAMLRDPHRPAAALRGRERPPLRRRAAPFSLPRSMQARGHRGWVLVAALLLLGAGGVLGRLAVSSRAPERESAVALQEVATARGQRATIRLSDGTRITLGAASTVRYARDFGARQHRDVYLDGQAYFEVVHDTLHPFAVHTARGVAEDLGTEFVVTAYSAMAAMQVVVASGKVMLRHAGPSVADSGIGHGRTAPRLTLGPGELGLIDSSGTITRSSVADASPYFDWTRGRLVFRGVPLRDALPAIGRWYDVEITLGDPALADRRLVADFASQSAQEVVQLLALAVNARYEQHGRSIVLLPRKGPAH